MIGLKSRLALVLERMSVAARRAGRAPECVRLLPVTKGQPASTLKEAIAAGFPAHFGENYLEELRLKRAAVAGVEWHYQGRLQSRKIAEIVSVADVVQTVSRAKEVEILAAEMARQGRRPKFFLQVNVSKEAQKNGCSPADMAALLDLVAKVSLEDRLVGLMCLPSDLGGATEARLRAEFAHLRSLRDEFVPRGLLSMGMSGDFEVAIEEGSDLVRVGTALFGARATRATPSRS